MLLILTQLKTISRPMTSLNAAALITLTLSLHFPILSFAGFGDFWPFKSDPETAQKMENKIEKKELSASTSYYARGPHFQEGQKWNEVEFLQQLQQQNYRLRDGIQSLSAGDAKKIDQSECFSSLPSEQKAVFSEMNFNCWVWQNHRGENFLVLIDETLRVLKTLKGLPWQKHWYAALDPVLVAQFRGQEPIMQQDYKISDIPIDCLNAHL